MELRRGFANSFVNKWLKIASLMSRRCCSVIVGGGDVGSAAIGAGEVWVDEDVVGALEEELEAVRVGRACEAGVMGAGDKVVAIVVVCTATATVAVGATRGEALTV